MIIGRSINENNKIKYFEKGELMKKYITINLYRWFGTIILTILIALGTIFSSYGRTLILDNFLANNHNYFLYGIVLILVMAITEILKSCLSINNAKLIKDWIVSIGSGVSENIEKMGYDNYHKLKHGEYISWYTTDLERISTSYFEPFLNLFSNVVLSTVSLIILFSINWKIGSVSLLLLIILMIVGTRFGKKIGMAYQKFSQLSGIYTNTLQEYTSAYDVLKNFNALSILKEKIKQVQTDLENQRVVAKKYTSFATLAFYGSQRIFEGIMFMFVLYLVLQKEISIGMLLSVPAILALFLNSTGMFLEIVIQMQGMNDIIEKLETKMIAETIEYDNLSLIEGNNITYSIDEKKIFDNLSFKFEKGKKYAILGPSGSGKSTLLNIILGRINNFDGELKVNGVVKEKNKDVLFSKEIAYVSQEGAIFNMSIRENILLGMKKTDEEIFDILKKVKLYDLVNNLPEKLDTIISLDGNNLSGGEKQRLTLARALIRNTPCIILDEATSAIDAKTAVAIEEQIVEDSEKTVIIISHHLDDKISSKLDKIYFL